MPAQMRRLSTPVDRNHHGQSSRRLPMREQRWNAAAARAIRAASSTSPPREAERAGMTSCAGLRRNSAGSSRLGSEGETAAMNVVRWKTVVAAVAALWLRQRRRRCSSGAPPPQSVSLRPCQTRSQQLLQTAGTFAEIRRSTPVRSSRSFPPTRRSRPFRRRPAGLLGHEPRQQLLSGQPIRPTTPPPANFRQTYNQISDLSRRSPIVGNGAGVRIGPRRHRRGDAIRAPAAATRSAPGGGIDDGLRHRARGLDKCSPPVPRARLAPADD